MYPEYDIWPGRAELNKDLQREAEAERRLHDLRFAAVTTAPDPARPAPSSAPACLCLAAPGSARRLHIK